MLQDYEKPSNAARIDVLLEMMEAVVLDELRASGGWLYRNELVEVLSLSQPSYPRHSKTQGETTWLAGVLLSRLQESGKLDQFEVGNRVRIELVR
jgi:hypothetical protein